MDLALDAARVNRRRTSRIVVRRLEDGEAPVMPHSSAQERIAAVTELTRASWQLAGFEVPDYPRHRTPIRVTSRSELAAETPAS